MNGALASGGQLIDGKKLVVINSTNSFPRFCNSALSSTAISPMTCA
jgi:hypothetical protein